MGVRKRRNIWWLRWRSGGGRRHEESSGSPKKSVALALLKVRMGDAVKGIVVTPKMAGYTLDAGVTDLIADLKLRGKKSANQAARRCRLHILPFFGPTRKLNSISVDDIRAYCLSRLGETEIKRGAYTLKTRMKDGTVREVAVAASTRRVEGPSHGTVNRELQLLRQLFRLAEQT